MNSVIRPEWAVSPAVSAFSTTRIGGISKPPFNAMNLGLHVGDEPAAVRHNRKFIAETCQLPVEPIWLNQTHGHHVACVETNHEQTVIAQNFENTDGAFTRLRNVVLVVLTADCLPVVLSDKQGTQCAVVHAGWRGLSNGILSNAMRLFDASSTIHAWLGPAIGPMRFEVGTDVLDAFTQYSQCNAAHFRAGKRSGKYMADIYALARNQLTDSGCVEVTGGEYCTHSQSELFHSHRRDGTASGRMATYVWLS